MSERPVSEDFPENEEYWRAIDEDRLLIRRCTECTKPHYYPRSHCPFCGSDATVWEEVSGLGRIYSFTIVRYASPPYCPVYVELDEGPTMLSTMIDCEFDALEIGAPVHVVYRTAADGRKVPMFTPAARQHTR